MSAADTVDAVIRAYTMGVVFPISLFFVCLPIMAAAAILACLK